ncbi:MAG: thioredoxin family protein [Phycisphaerales bacterium]
MPRPTLKHLTALIALLAAVSIAVQPARSAPPDFSGAPSVAGMPGANTAQTVTTSSQALDTNFWSGVDASLVVAVTLNHAPGYHTWPAEGDGELPPEIDAFAIRTNIELIDAPEWASLRAVQWPDLHDSKVADVMNPGKTVSVRTYSGRAVAFATIDLAPSAPAGEHTLSLKVSWQACNDTNCDMPTDATERITINIKQRSALYGSYEPKPRAAGSATNTDNPAPTPDTPANSDTPGPTRTTTDPPPAASSQPPAPSIFGFDLAGTSGIVALLVLFLASAVGGFVLNLMPCVLPVIPIKILTLTKHAGTRRRAIVLGLWTALGVVFFWAAVGIPVAVLRETIGDPSRLIFGNWWVALGIGVLLVMLALGSMGLFQFKLPQGAYMLNPDPNRPWGSFLFGIMTALLGLPCFGFAAGGLLAPMATMHTTAIITVFVGIGVGMAVPYFVLSAFPNLLKKLPKAGPASDLIKQVMGLLLIAAAAFFGAVGFYQLAADHPWITTNIKWIVATAFTVLACIWLIARSLKVSKSMLAIAFSFILAGLMITGAVWYTYNESSKSRINWLVTSGLGEDEIIPGYWLEYTPGRYETARRQGKVIVIDFTAEWCINCKAYKSAVLDSSAVAERMKKGDVITFEGDVTSRSRPAQALMDEWGQTGIPLLAVLAPGEQTPVFSNSAPASAVVEMIDRAAGNPPRADRSDQTPESEAAQVAQRR